MLNEHNFLFKLEFIDLSLVVYNLNQVNVYKLLIVRYFIIKSVITLIYHDCHKII